MTGAELIGTLRKRGVTLEGRGDRLRWRAPKGALDEEHRARLAGAKWAVLAELLAALKDDPEHWLFCFNERAAIMQICGGLSRVEAERLAYGELLRGVV